MTEKDFCEVAWNESKVVRMPEHIDRIVYDRDPEIQREYDKLNIDWSQIDFGRPLQELGRELYQRYKK